MELPKPEESENTDRSGIKLVDTPDSDNESNFRLSRDMDSTTELGSPSGGELISSRFLVISSILLDSLQQCLSFGFVFSSSLLAELFKCGCDFLVSFLFLFKSFGFWWYSLLSLHFIHNLIL